MHQSEKIILKLKNGANMSETDIDLVRVVGTLEPLEESYNEKSYNDVYSGFAVRKDKTMVKAIIKDLDYRQLLNEVVVYLILSELKLPTPQCYVGLTVDDEHPPRKGPELDSGMRLVFVSSTIEKKNLRFLMRPDGTLPAKIMDALTAWEYLGDAAAIDTWVANVDRHMGNLLYGGEDEFWLIDHGHCFGGPEGWLKEPLDPSENFVCKLSAKVRSHLSSNQQKLIYDKVIKLHKKIENISLRTIISQSKGKANGDKTSCRNIEEFLIDRIKHIKSIAGGNLNILSMVV